MDERIIFWCNEGSVVVVAAYVRVVELLREMTIILFVKSRKELEKCG